MANPQIAQGTLVRVKASMLFTSFADLNITSPYLGRAGLSMGPDGPATSFIPTMTGAIQSQEVYQKMTVTAALLRTQDLANQFKRKMESNSYLGAATIRPDVVTGGISSYDLINCGIENVREMSFNGSDEAYAVIIGGYYLINNDLFN